MNKERRKRISLVVNCLEALMQELDIIREEESASYDNLPESLRDTEKAEQMQEAVSTLESAFTELEEATDSLTKYCEQKGKEV